MSAADLEDASETIKQADTEDESLQSEDLLNTDNVEGAPEDTQEENSRKKRSKNGIGACSTFHDPAMMKCFSFNSEPESYNQESLIPTNNYNFKYVPFFCTTEYLTASVDDKVHMLKECHLKLSKHKANLYSKSFILAPLPPPIELYSPSNDAHENNFNEVDSVENTYISRSGRCTKRKNYSETLTLRENKEIKSEHYADMDWSSRNSSGNKNSRKRRKNDVEILKTLSEKSSKKQKDGIEAETSTLATNEAPELDMLSPTATEKNRDLNRSENQGLKNVTTRKGSRKLPVERSESKESLSRIEEEDYEVCPICSKTFPIDEIEGHASSCGEMR